MSSKTLRIAGVSDVSIGYGSPQIPAFMTSLSQHYGQHGAVLLEPDQPEKAPRHHAYPSLSVKRVRTAIHPHSGLGRIEFIAGATKALEALDPDVLVIFCSYSLPVLFKLRRRPRLVIYYAIEQPSAYGPTDVEMNRHLDGLVDLIIYPEENRAARDIETCGYKNVPLAVLYNCANPNRTDHLLPPEARNGRMLYQGAIEKGRTFAEYYADQRLGLAPIDLFGPFGGPDHEETKALLSAGPNGVRYLGLVDSGLLASLRPHYTFSIVSWRPDNENQLYACPNKFFEAVADGVPPITAPHPQTVALVKKYGCGILMDDWSFDSFRSALKRAQRIYGTSEYVQMVENCKRAVAAELNWDKQFEKVRAFL